jgi:hypothetical protein
VPFLGAGVNLCDRPPEAIWESSKTQYLPSGGELAQYLAGAFHFPNSHACGIGGCQRPLVELDLAKVSQYGATVLGTGRLYEELNTLFTGQFTPTIVHRFLAELSSPQVPRPVDRHLLIVSTNYDDLIEKALGDGNFDLIYYDPDSEPRPRFWHRGPNMPPREIDSPNDYDYEFFTQRPVVLKIHGTADRVDQDRMGFVITEDHYIEYLAEEPLEKLLPPALLHKMRNQHLLFLGYSLRDWNFRVFLRKLKRDKKWRYMSWAVLLQTDDAETKFWQKNEVDIVNLELQLYIEKLKHELVLREARSIAEGSGI